MRHHFIGLFLTLAELSACATAERGASDAVAGGEHGAADAVASGEHGPGDAVASGERGADDAVASGAHGAGDAVTSGETQAGDGVTPEASQAPLAHVRFGPGIDLSGFVDVTTAVVKVGGTEWLTLVVGGEAVQLTPVPPPLPDGCRSPHAGPGKAVSGTSSCPCASGTPFYLGFATTPRTRLTLSAGRIALEQETARCWVEVPRPGERLVATRPRVVKGRASEALTTPLGALDRGLEGLSVHIDEGRVALVRDGDEVASETLDEASLVTDGAERGGDHRTLTVVAHRRGGRVAVLELAVDETLTGSSGPIGGSRAYHRTLRWQVSLDGPGIVTLGLDAAMEAPFSGDGYQGSDKGYRQVWGRVFEGGWINGRWSDSLRREAALHEQQWLIAQAPSAPADDGPIEFGLELPTVESAPRTTLPLAASHTVSLASETVLRLEPGALVLTARGERTSWLLLPSPGESDRVTLSQRCRADVCRIDASAVRPAPSPAAGSAALEESEALEGVSYKDTRSVSLLVSRKTGQALVVVGPPGTVGPVGDTRATSP